MKNVEAITAWNDMIYALEADDEHGMMQVKPGDAKTDAMVELCDLSTSSHSPFCTCTLTSIYGGPNIC